MLPLDRPFIKEDNNLIDAIVAGIVDRTGVSEETAHGILLFSTVSDLLITSPNFTHGQKVSALIDNVIDEYFRQSGVK